MNEKDKKAMKPWSMTAVNDYEGEIILYGDIEDYTPWWAAEDEMFITPKGFLEDLQTVADKAKITIRLNSGGGSLNTGIAMHNAIKALPGEKTVIVEGLAASAASVLMCAGDIVKVYPGSMVMIHEPRAGIYSGFYDIAELEKGIKMLEAGINASVAIYKEKTGLDEDTLRSMMTDETWMTGEQAVENKFANELITDGVTVSAQMSGNFLMVAGIKHDVQSLHRLESLNLPKVEPGAQASVDKAPAAGGDMKKGAKNMNANITTVEELRASAPDLVAEIEAAAADKAVKAEHARLKAIDSIAATVTDAQMVEDAKFGEHPMTAEQLAFKAMQQQAALGVTVAANIAKDAKDSHVNEVTAQADAEPIGGQASADANDSKAREQAGAEAAKKVKF